MFYKDGKKLAIAGDNVSNDDGSNPSGEHCANLVDGCLGTKWLDRKSKPVVFELPAPSAIDGYAFASASQHPADSSHAP